MRLRRPGQSENRRVAVFLAVVGLHVLAGLFFGAAGTQRSVRLRSAATPLSLVWLSQSPPRRSTAPPASILSQPLRIREAARESDQPPGPEREPEPNNAITLPVDLSGAADAAARRQSEKEEGERRWRNLAGPSESQLEWSRNNVPPARDHHLLGDDEHAEGGELITWVNDRCYYTTHGATTFGMPQTSKLCKDPPKPETELFKNMRQQLDDSAKGRAP